MRMVLPIQVIVVTAAVAFGPSSVAALDNFSCDVNTTQCSCVGSPEGADCKGMQANCKDFPASKGGKSTGKILICTATGCTCQYKGSSISQAAGGPAPKVTVKWKRDVSGASKAAPTR